MIETITGCSPEAEERLRLLAREFAAAFARRIARGLSPMPKYQGGGRRGRERPGPKARAA